MMKLSNNLTLDEVIRSTRAKQLGIDNTPHGDHLDALFSIAQNIFQPLREAMGVSITVSSGYRSPALNAATPGSSTTSQHSKGEALDLVATGGKTNKDLFDYIRKNLPFDQLIWEFGDDKNPAWVHVSHKHNGTQRGQILKATKVNGKSTYSVFNPK